VAELKSFGSYFVKEWIESRFNQWQCFRSPSGSAKTNNPVEQFNRAIKRDYSMGSLLSLNRLVNELLKCARAKSIVPTQFIVDKRPSADMIRRHKYLVDGCLISATIPRRTAMSFLLGGESNMAIVTQSGLVDRNKVKKTKGKGGLKFFGINNWRANKYEMHSQPSEGWKVTVDPVYCKCKTFFKWDCCVHAISAMKMFGMELPGHRKPEGFVNRRHTSSQVQNRQGRPRNVGSALQLS
jgi:hypothetical protein